MASPRSTPRDLSEHHDEYRDLTLNGALTRAASRWSDRQFLRVDGAIATFGEFDHDVGRLARGLCSDHGIERGSHVAGFLPNTLATVHAWFATTRLGAVWVPINTEFRGVGLHRAVVLSNAALFVTTVELYPVLRAALDEAGVSVPVVVLGSGGGDTPGLDTLYRSEPIVSVPDLAVGDPAGMLYTSGTTAGSKACLLSHRYFISQATILLRDMQLMHDDVLYCPFPLSHADATALTTVPALLLGATAALGQRFSASRFWDEVREHQATVIDFMGATLSILWKAEPRKDDLDNPVRLAWGVPVPDWAPQFEQRFGLTICELYGSTEASLPATQRFGTPRVPGSCGRATEEFELRIADDDDRPLPPDEPGQLLIRPREPDVMFSGYHADPDATARVTRNLWFHSGDLARLDADGNLFFIGRRNDVIRRRGENISADEVEEGVLRHPSIVECAAIGVASELTEEDLKILVVVRPGHDLGAASVREFCVMTMARFQVPRYVEIVAQLPRTATGKTAEAFIQQEGARILSSP